MALLRKHQAEGACCASTSSAWVDHTCTSALILLGAWRKHQRVEPEPEAGVEPQEEEAGTPCKASRGGRALCGATGGAGCASARRHGASAFRQTLGCRPSRSCRRPATELLPLSPKPNVAACLTRAGAAANRGPASADHRRQEAAALHAAASRIPASADAKRRSPLRRRELTNAAPLAPLPLRAGCCAAQ